jgi:predicted Ser/Thr protein kinase/MFS family permease
MAIACPYCGSSIALKKSKSGKYSPKCPKCARVFQLLIPDDPQQAPTVSAVAEPVADPNVGGVSAPSANLGATTAVPVASAAPGAAADPVVAAEKAAEPLPPPKPAKEFSTEKTLASLGGYKVLKLLGKGGMGAVYLARQVSLDRLVAVKVMLPKAAADPAFVARFTREAYAAAQLVHHNVVQIYDIGSDKKTHYFSMEFVQGESLMGLIRREGKLDPEQAVGYVLQAARGLKYGHDMGMVHRDVKPDNLLLNNQGIVKVADMGLVKLAGVAEKEAAAGAARVAALAKQSGAVDLTRAGYAMGTPSYMAPEQAANSSGVGPAADVYSLGCTLYVLLTGEPPFEGKTAMEVLTKHATAPIVRPEVVVKRVPAALSDILVKMLAKNPEDRLPDMGGVIEALENYLGVARSGPFTPREEHAEALEKGVAAFNTAPALKPRRLVLLGFAGAVAALTLLSLLIGWTTLAGGFLGLGLLTPVFYFLARGFFRKTPLFLKVRELVLSSGPRDWLVWGVSALLLIVLLWLLGLLGTWILVSVLAVGAAFGIFFGLDRRVEAERVPALADAEKLLKTMRLNGLEEESLRRFVCKYSGSRWEEFFEALFGYEAKLAAREWSRGEMGKAREKFAAWREPMIAWIDARQQARKAAAERRHLKTVEAQALQAQGMNAAEAEEKAEQVAEVMVQQAAVVKATASQPPPIAVPLPVAAAASASAETVDFHPATPAPAANLKEMLETARAPERLFTLKPKKKAGPNPAAALLGEWIGPRVRFLLGALLLGGFLTWLYQNDLLAGDKLLKQIQAMLPFSTTQPKPVQNLALLLIPSEIAKVFGGLHAGLAGLILAVSGVFRSRRMTLAVVPGAAAVVVAPWVAGWFSLPSLGQLDASLAFLCAGLALAAFGLVFLRKILPTGPRAYDDE